MLQRGAYPAARAAALSGVPLSTVHWWARNDVLVPSISKERVKLWSYADLMGLRVIYWLRQAKTDEQGAEIPRSAMPAVRQALAQLRELDMDLWGETGPNVLVDPAGTIHLATAPDAELPGRQRVLDDDALNLIAPFSVGAARGPNLVAPRPQLRIVPGKLGGSPHVQNTRVESQALSALRDSGLPTATIYELYPSVSEPAIDEALDLETQLAKNLRAAA